MNDKTTRSKSQPRDGRRHYEMPRVLESTNFETLALTCTKQSFGSGCFGGTSSS